MKNNGTELLCLKKHMKINNMLPAEKVIVDNQRHVYWITNNGLSKQASYIATRNPIGKSGPSLICSYGFIDEKEQLSYSSSE